MSSRFGVFCSSVGTKILIGVTGVALFLYLVIHIAGNLIVFLGPAAFNRYAFVMEYANPLLPVIEIGLLLIFLLHVYRAVTMFLAGSHLWHGIASAFQSMGADHPKWTPRLLTTGKVIAVLMAGGFIVIALWAHFVGART